MPPVTKPGLYPIRLPDTPTTQGPVPLSSSPINQRVCEFIEQYESHLDRTLTQGTQLARRWVLEDESLFASLIPRCPPVADYASLPVNEIDCVASILEVPANFWARGCYVLRLRAVPDQITFELYVCAVPTLVGAIPLQFRTMGHHLSLFFDSAKAAQAKQKGPPLKQAMDQAQVKSQRYQVLVMKAIEAALLIPPQQRVPASPPPRAQNPPTGSAAPVIPAAPVAAPATPPASPAGGTDTPAPAPTPTTPPPRRRRSI